MPKIVLLLVYLLQNCKFYVIVNIVNNVKTQFNFICSHVTKMCTFLTLHSLININLRL